MYVHLLGDDEADRVPAAYGDNYQRLVEVETSVGSDSVFRNHNAEPST